MEENADQKLQAVKQVVAGLAAGIASVLEVNFCGIDFCLLLFKRDAPSKAALASCATPENAAAALRAMADRLGNHRGEIETAFINSVLGETWPDDDEGGTA